MESSSPIGDSQNWLWSPDGELRLDQLQQHAACARRVHKDVTVPPRAGLDLFGNQAYSASLEFFDRLREVSDTEGNMVQPLAALCQELGDHRIVRSGL